MFNHKPHSRNFGVARFLVGGFFSCEEFVLTLVLQKTDKFYRIHEKLKRGTFLQVEVLLIMRR